MHSQYLTLLCVYLFVLMSCTKKVSYNVNEIKDVEYGQNITYLHSTEVLTMDIYSPKDASVLKKYPLVVMAHGGGFAHGSKKGLADICKALAQRGMIAATINYRLGWYSSDAPNCQGDTTALNEALYRGIQDFSAALRFLTAHANTYHIDTNWVFAGGASAGAAAALNSAYLTDTSASVHFKKSYDKLGSLFTASNKLVNTYTIKGICSMWGAIYDIEAITASTALPVICYYGDLDNVVPLKGGNYQQCPNYEIMYGSIAIYNRLKQLGIPAVTHVYRGEGHGPSQYIDNPEFIAATAYCFFDGLRNKKPQTGMYYGMASNCK